MALYPCCYAHACYTKTAIFSQIIFTFLFLRPYFPKTAIFWVIFTSCHLDTHPLFLFFAAVSLLVLPVHPNINGRDNLVDDDKNDDVDDDDDSDDGGDGDDNDDDDDVGGTPCTPLLQPCYILSPSPSNKTNATGHHILMTMSQ